MYVVLKSILFQVMFDAITLANVDQYLRHHMASPGARLSKHRIRSNSNFAENFFCPGFNCNLSIMAKFGTRHNSVDVRNFVMICRVDL